MTGGPPAAALRHNEYRRIVSTADTFTAPVCSVVAEDSRQ